MSGGGSSDGDISEGCGDHTDAVRFLNPEPIFLEMNPKPLVV
jgi:hypothetical protein